MVDFAVEAPGETIAGRLADEMFVYDGWAEAGYDQGRRIRLRTWRPDSQHDLDARIEAGGAGGDLGRGRGITALVATELARTWRPTLLILGTTPLPEEGEASDTTGLTGEAEIKAALLARYAARDGREPRRN